MSGIVDSVSARLGATRRRTLDLVSLVDDADLTRQISPLMSPLVWDLAHVGNYEELWLLNQVAGIPTTSSEYDDMYNAFEHPRRERPALALLGPGAARAYIAEVRERALEHLETLDPGRFRPWPSLVPFVYDMVVQHEQQHVETMLATLALMGEADPTRGLRPDTPDSRTAPDPSGLVTAGTVDLPGGNFAMGTDEDLAYDNERPAHTVRVEPFRMDVRPVTSGEYLEFVEAGGYDDESLWHPNGWAFVEGAGLEAPQYWLRDTSGGWLRNRFGHVEPLREDEPVMHVCWYEADAYSRWRGGRLPTEAEWEHAASWTPEGRKVLGTADEASDADLWTEGETQRFGPLPATAGTWTSPAGCVGMLGGVWEWTSTDFRGYPGFVSSPYDEYSEVFFGSNYKVLRGGSWATHPWAARTTFRNWDFPIRRQIFSGFRCAWDARPNAREG